VDHPDAICERMVAPQQTIGQQVGCLVFSHGTSDWSVPFSFLPAASRSTVCAERRAESCPLGSARYRL